LCIFLCINKQINKKPNFSKFSLVETQTVTDTLSLSLSVHVHRCGGSTWWFRRCMSVHPNPLLLSIILFYFIKLLIKCRCKYKHRSLNFMQHIFFVDLLKIGNC
jgi:hypothetical protein